MGTISEKITYLNGTKEQIKEALNSLGASIIDNDTFRSYVEKINEIYDELPKVTGNGTTISLNNTRKGKLQISFIGNYSQSGTPAYDNPAPISVATGTQSIAISNSDSTLSENYNLRLGNLELFEYDSDYKDEIYLYNNKWYLKKAIHKITFNGSETWNISATNNYNIKRFRYLGIKNELYDVGENSNIAKIISQRFETLNANQTYARNNGISADKNNEVLIYCDAANDTATNFKNWLSSNNVICYYVLKTPEVTEITNLNYPDLYEDLENIKSVLSYDGSTNVASNGSIAIKMNVSALKSFI